MPNMEQIWNKFPTSQASKTHIKKAAGFSDLVLNSDMLSAIVLAPGPTEASHPRLQEALVRSLSVLVGAAVADLVRDACIVGPPGLRLEAIADHAGCGLIEDSDPRRALTEALRAVRSERVFVLAGGFAPGSGFIDEMSDWLDAVVSPAAALRCEADSLLRRMAPSLSPVVGLVAARPDCLAATAATPASLARALKAKTLRTRARRVV